ncbi:Nitrate/nitrite sensor protein [Cupriavidus basilensis]|uniref:Sensor protein n=1 Tax=Cupriavidus basilensis TaxID=68895 RepID=A0A0C4Y882_9BURK|nr:Nitrate/nitrite sensor protein [Cupriavidus basilensis]
MHRPGWSLLTKLLAIGAAVLCLALTSIGLTLWVTWQIEGGAAAVNEAGRMRMQGYRLALAMERGATMDTVTSQLHESDQGLALLASGDPSRPLFVPWNAETRAQFATVQQGWASLRAHWLSGAPAPAGELDRFAAAVDALVSGIELQLSRWTARLHMFQLAMVALVIASAVTLLYAGYLIVFEPLTRLRRGLQRIETADLGARVAVTSQDEFGELAEGFNHMAAKLEALYGDLEQRVNEKTARLERERMRLAALYEMSGQIAQAATLDELAKGFARKVRAIAHADAVAIRWSDAANQRYLLLAGDCLPQVMFEQERCLHPGACHCAQAGATAQLRVIPIRGITDDPSIRCARAGYRTLVCLPVKLQQRVLGEIDLFFLEETSLTAEDRSLLEALAAHLASAMEGLRAGALEKEATVAQERGLLAQELHDSIAQSLAFLRIQVELMRTALGRRDAPALDKVLAEIETGVHETYNDVRELLVHFRTRTNHEDIEPALRTTLQKFEHQTGLRTHLRMEGHDVPLMPDVQVQVLHVIQEALSNIRKHAHATQVWIDVRQAEVWRFEVRDDGLGFNVAQPPASAQLHVGLRIMHERAQRIGATVTLTSGNGHGTRVTLTLPPRRPALREASSRPARMASTLQSH